MAISCAAKVYVATVPLRVPAGPPTWFIRALNSSHFLPNSICHYMTIVQSDNHFVVFDFQPLNPEHPLVALSVLLGHKVPGIIQERKLTKLSSNRVRLIGKMLPGFDLVSAKTFNKSWPLNLVLHKHDCRHHTSALVKHLTGFELELPTFPPQFNIDNVQ